MLSQLFDDIEDGLAIRPEDKLAHIVRKVFAHRDGFIGVLLDDSRAANNPIGFDIYGLGVGIAGGGVGTGDGGSHGIIPPSIGIPYYSILKIKLQEDRADCHTFFTF